MTKSSTANVRYLDYDQYAEMCRDVGMGQGEDESLAFFLHEIGAVFYDPDHFGPRLIVDQQWAIEAVYSLLDRTAGTYAMLQLAAQHGLTIDMLRAHAWQQFTVDEHRLLVEFMTSCEICFEFSEGRYYVPQLLADDMPTWMKNQWLQRPTHVLRIDYPYLHRAIIDRFPRPHRTSQRR